MARLWHGELPLERIFWLYVVAIGVLVNLITSSLFLAFVSADRILLAFLIGYGVSLPYNALALTGLWRATQRGDPPPRDGPLLMAIAIVLMVLLSVT